MIFKEKSKQSYVLSQGAIAFSVIDFEIIGNLHQDGRNIVHDFINLPEDFEFARKYVGGYVCDHTNEFGERKVTKVYDFGPYPIELLESEDYKKILLEEFENQTVEMLSSYNINKEIEFIEFINNVKSAFKEVKINSHDFYQLLPDDWKYDDLSSFQLSSYLCGFSINRIDKVFTVFQIDDD